VFYSEGMRCARKFINILILLSLGALAACAAEGNPMLRRATVLPLLPPGPGNPRNTEGSFATLKDGRILFAYTRFTGGGGDNDAASIVGRYSRDGGRSWSTEDVPIVAREGQMNSMSVSLLRLADGRLALFYLRKNSNADCRPYLRYSSDEARTWSEPILCVRDTGYFVLNNDRAVQLRSGRIVLPVALHLLVNGENGPGIAMTWFSDDAGKTWRRSRSTVESPTPSRAGMQEPGVVELKDGRLMMFIRTSLGSQYLSYSSDGGDTWSAPKASSIVSPLSPASIKRIPSTGDLLVVWNDHAGIDAALERKRTPLTVAVSRDEGQTWTNKQNLLADPAGWYCYTAIHFAGRRVLLGFNAGGSGLPHLSRTDIAWFDVKQLYRKVKK
jgi:sialidase-1